MNGTNGTSHDAKIEVIKIKNKIRIDYSLWYGLPARIVAALYNCSASMTRTSMCGQTILPKDIFKFDFSSIFASKPSAPPIIKWQCPIPSATQFER